MKCPYCNYEDTKVIDSRPTEDGHAIRRRRGCEKCGKRFTTYEKVEESIIMIVKKDGSREAFDRGKLMNGIIRACEKRPVPMATIEGMVDRIERGLNNLMQKEVKSDFIGELVMDEGYVVGNVDATVIAQKPKLRPYIEQMEENVARCLGIDVSQVNIKATTEEHLGFTGREEGISSQAVCLLYEFYDGSNVVYDSGRSCEGCAGCARNK